MIDDFFDSQTQFKPVEDLQHKLTAQTDASKDLLEWLQNQKNIPRVEVYKQKQTDTEDMLSLYMAMKSAVEHPTNIQLSDWLQMAHGDNQLLRYLCESNPLPLQTMVQKLLIDVVCPERNSQALELGIDKFRHHLDALKDVMSVLEDRGRPPRDLSKRIDDAQQIIHNDRVILKNRVETFNVKMLVLSSKFEGFLTNVNQLWTSFLMSLETEFQSKGSPQKENLMYQSNVASFEPLQMHNQFSYVEPSHMSFNQVPRPQLDPPKRSSLQRDSFSKSMANFHGYSTYQQPGNSMTAVSGFGYRPQKNQQRPFRERPSVIEPNRSHLDAYGGDNVAYLGLQSMIGTGSSQTGGSWLGRR